MINHTTNTTATVLDTVDVLRDLATMPVGLPKSPAGESFSGVYSSLCDG